MASPSPVHGIQYIPEDTATLIPRPAPHAPVRSITAHQLARLVHHYNTTDVDDSVLFPFLHGLEGNNVAQNMFFNQARNRNDRPKVPRYRGLMLVRCDENGLALDSRGNVRNYNSPTDGDTSSDDDDDDEDEEDEDESYTDESVGPMVIDTTLHMHPVADRHRVSKHETDSPSPSNNTTSPSTTSFSISNYFPSPSGSSASLSHTSPPSTPNPSKAADGTLPAQANNDLAQQQTADHSTPIPHPVDKATSRRPSHVLTCSFHPDELLTTVPSGPMFINPRIPDGISLRNFGIQVPIYATLSDIVIYSPKGPTRNAFALAEKFKHAIEAKAAERGWVVPGTDGQTEATMANEGLAYNVYLVVDSFETFEQEYPHLVSINSQGRLTKKVDFMEREKEEMRSLTKATEIAEGVWLGNTSDVPLLSNPPTPISSPRVLPSGLPITTQPAAQQLPTFDPFDGSNNPGGYDICIECHDMASFPTFSQLRSVEDRLRSLEDGWRAKVRQKETEERRTQQLKEQLQQAGLGASIAEKMELDSGASSKQETGLALDIRGQTSEPPLEVTANIGGNDAVIVSSPVEDSSNTPSTLPNTPRDPASTPTPGGLPKFDGPPAAPPTRQPTSSSQKPRTLPPRPPPNAAHVIHLSFPSSPPASPGTLTNLIPFLHFLHSLARPRPVSPEEVAAAAAGASRRTRSPSVSSGTSSAMRSPPTTMGHHSRNASGSNLVSMGATAQNSTRSRSYTLGSPRSMSNGGKVGQQQGLPPSHLPLSRPLKILLHAGDGYTETSVLALSYLMLTGNRTLPEAYLELQVSKERSFFVYGADVGILRRVEARLKTEREREMEKHAAGAASTSTPPPSNGSKAVLGLLASGPSTKDLAAGNVAGSGAASVGRWKWNGWRTGSLGGVAAASVGSLLSSTGVFGAVPVSSPTAQNDRDGSSLGLSKTPTPTDGNNSPSSTQGSLPSTAPDTSPTSTSVQPAQTVSPSASFPSLPLTPDDVLYEQPSSMNTNGARTTISNRPSSLSQSYAAGQPVPLRRARASTSPMLPSFVVHDTWFNDPKFDGSFPSRVLPFLYLGNLAHASNAYMLHALGITHVVSVGECALIPPPSEYQASMSFSGQNGISTLQYGPAVATVGSSGPVCGYGPSKSGHGTLWMEEREGRIKVLDIKGVCDDGIDSLRPQIAPTVEWIDKAMSEGGKVLVHCRVGVSRSATVTIAYVMHYLNCSLVDAYLMVRSRRLSVLIQPNMRLLYNLCGWEIELARKRAEAEAADIPLGQGRRLSWPFLAREVHILNERYLS